jgi:hypothetical protein
MKKLLLILGVACSILTGCSPEAPVKLLPHTEEHSVAAPTLKQEQTATTPDLPAESPSKESKKVSLTDNISCTDSEYKIYKQYDEFLDANPSTPDYTLRGIFAKKVRMQPAALKKLYTECTFRWTKERPGEAQAYAAKAMVEDAARIRNSK